MPSFRAEVFIGGHWADKGLNFPTRQEALDYGRSSDTAAIHRAVESDDDANYRFVDGVLSRYTEVFFNPYGALYAGP